MSNGDTNYQPEILDLISQELVIANFDGRNGHYIRMNLYDGNDNFVKSYYSNLTWKLNGMFELDPNGQNYRIYYNSEFQPYLDPEYGQNEALGYPGTPISNEIIQVPIYFDGSGNIFEDPECANYPSCTEEEILYNVLSKDDEMIHTTGTYNYKLDSIYNVLEEFFEPRIITEDPE